MGNYTENKKERVVPANLLRTEDQKPGDCSSTVTQQEKKIYDLVVIDEKLAIG